MRLTGNQGRRVRRCKSKCEVAVAQRRDAAAALPPSDCYGAVTHRRNDVKSTERQDVTAERVCVQKRVVARARFDEEPLRQCRRARRRIE
jgi:hypothetical protein